MAHPKHHHGHGQQPVKKTKYSTFWVLALGAVALMGLLWIAVSKPAPTPTPVPTVAPTAPVNNDYLNHILVAQAVCDHFPVWKEDPKRRLIVVSARPAVKIHSIEVRYGEDHKLLAASVRLGTLPKDEDQSSMRIYGAFDEGMHGARLEIIVQYIVKGIKFETILHCPIQVTN